MGPPLGHPATLVTVVVESNSLKSRMSSRLSDRACAEEAKYEDGNEARPTFPILSANVDGDAWILFKLLS
eukprot:scaffold278875_cov28-Attheya_sp.AAC.1